MFARRAGFTLIEVALVVVVGLFVLQGVLLLYQANRDEACGAIARKRVLSAQTTIEAMAASGSAYPTSGSGSFSTSWSRAHPDESTVSPWGGAPADTATGCSEDAPIADGADDPAAAPDKTATLAVDGTRQSNLHYVSITGNRHVRVTTRHTGDSKVYRGYLISMYDGRGNPWFDAVGGSK